MNQPSARRRIQSAPTALAVLLAAGVLSAAAPADARGAKETQTAGPKAPTPEESTLMTWLRHLSEGLADAAGPLETQTNLAAVAAVRGSAQSSPSLRSPAWIGGIEARKAARLKAERQELKRAVDLGLTGKIREALKVLSSFEKNHPRSPLVPDAIKARAKFRRLEETIKKGLDAKPPQNRGR